MKVEAQEFVDAHCHVDLYDSPQAIVSLVQQRRIHTIAVTNAPFVFEFTLKLAEGNGYLHPAVGLHPELVADHGGQIEQLKQLISRTRFVGEVGLDYVTQDAELRKKQRSVFQQVLNDCAAAKNKVLTIHARRASSDVIDMVGNRFPGTVILHWFSGTQKELHRALDYGFYFSVNQAMFQSKSGCTAIGAIPKERLLTETDGPFTRDRDKAATPETVIKICSLLGEKWSTTPEDVAQLIRENFRVVAGAENSAEAVSK